MRDVDCNGVDHVSCIIVFAKNVIPSASFIVIDLSHITSSDTQALYSPPPADTSSAGKFHDKPFHDKDPNRKQTPARLVSFMTNPFTTKIAIANRHQLGW